MRAGTPGKHLRHPPAFVAGELLRDQLPAPAVVVRRVRRGDLRLVVQRPPAVRPLAADDLARDLDAHQLHVPRDARAPRRGPQPPRGGGVLLRAGHREPVRGVVAPLVARLDPPPRHVVEGRVALHLRHPRLRPRRARAEQVVEAGPQVQVVELLPAQRPPAPAVGAPDGEVEAHPVHDVLRVAAHLDPPRGLPLQPADHGRHLAALVRLHVACEGLADVLGVPVAPERPHAGAAEPPVLVAAGRPVGEDDQEVRRRPREPRRGPRLDLLLRPRRAGRPIGR
eukprot:gene5646-biopygen9198